MFERADIIYKDRARSYVFNGPITEAPDAHRPDDEWRERVTIQVYHSKDHKSFVAYVRRSKVATTSHGYSIEHHSPFDDSATILTQRVARYSERALESTCNDVIARCLSILSDESDTSLARAILLKAQSYALSLN